MELSTVIVLELTQKNVNNKQVVGSLLVFYDNTGFTYLYKMGAINYHSPRNANNREDGSSKQSKRE